MSNHTYMIKKMGKGTYSDPVWGVYRISSEVAQSRKATAPLLTQSGLTQPEAEEYIKLREKANKRKWR